MLVFDHSPHYRIFQGDSRQLLRDWPEPVDLIITSPPYADARQKQYGGIDPDAYADWLVSFHDVFWQALKPEGSLILNLKDKVVDGVRHPYVWQSIEGLVAQGWYFIEHYIWHKKTAMPGFWPTRLRDAWENCFHLAKCKRPYMDQEAVKIPIAASTQKRSSRLSPRDLKRTASATGSGLTRHHAYWQHQTKVLPTNVLHLSPETRNQGHPAVFPVALPQFFIQLFSPPGGLILDPFAGSGTTGVAALSLDRRVILMDHQKNYCERAQSRLRQSFLLCHKVPVKK